MGSKDVVKYAGVVIEYYTGIKISKAEGILVRCGVVSNIHFMKIQRRLILL